jgi:hypothetical protein
MENVFGATEDVSQWKTFFVVNEKLHQDGGKCFTLLRKALPLSTLLCCHYHLHYCQWPPPACLVAGI